VSDDSWEVKGIAEAKEWKKGDKSKVETVNFMLKRLVYEKRLCFERS
jgi:hypothetical protein